LLIVALGLRAQGCGVLGCRLRIWLMSGEFLDRKRFLGNHFNLVSGRRH
jgi:hypothetical protein